MAPSEQSYSSSSFSYSSSSSASASVSAGGTRSGFSNNSYQSYTDGQGNNYSSSTSSNPSGTTIRDNHRDPEGRETSNTTRLDSQGRELGDSGTSQGRIEDVTDREAADKLYDERIEDEYAKREGGA